MAGDLVRVSDLKEGDHFTDGEGVLYRVYMRMLAGVLAQTDGQDFLETFEEYLTVHRAPAPEKGGDDA